MPACSSNFQGNNYDMHTKSLVSVHLDSALCQQSVAHNSSPSEIVPTLQFFANVSALNASSDMIGSTISSSFNTSNVEQSTIPTINGIVGDNSDGDTFAHFRQDWDTYEETHSDLSCCER